MTEKERLQFAFSPERWRPMAELDLATWRDMTPQERIDIAEDLRDETAEIRGLPTDAHDEEDFAAYLRVRAVFRGNRA